MESWWWIAPGGVVIGVGVAVLLVNLVLTIVGRRQLRLALVGVRLRFIGIGLVSVGLGARFILEALLDGPNVGLLALGALVALFGGLYFIAATDRIFKLGPLGLRRPTLRAGEQHDPEPREGRCVPAYSFLCRAARMKRRTRRLTRHLSGGGESSTSLTRVGPDFPTCRIMK